MSKGAKKNERRGEQEGADKHEVVYSGKGGENKE